MIHFTLYSRSYCHLCEEMLEALRALSNECAFSVEVLDVDADPALVARYDELVPVLLGRKNDDEPIPLCHYFLDASRVRSFIGSA